MMGKIVLQETDTGIKIDVDGFDDLKHFVSAVISLLVYREASARAEGYTIKGLRDGVVAIVQDDDIWEGAIACALAENYGRSKPDGGTT